MNSAAAAAAAAGSSSGMLTGGATDSRNQSSSQSSAAAAAAAAASARDMYGSMNGYMPNGYHSAYSSDPNMYGSSLYSRYDVYGASNPAAAVSSYMNGSYMSMYGAPAATGGSAAPASSSNAAPPPGQSSGGSPYGSMQSMSPVGHASHSPGSAASESGGGGPPAATVPIPSTSPSTNGLSGYNLKREPSPGPHHAVSGGPSAPPGPPGTPNGQPQDLNRMISMYLPGDAAAAAAGDPNAQSRIQSMYAGHYQAMMGQAGAAEHLMAGHHHAMSMAHM